MSRHEDSKRSDKSSVPDIGRRNLLLLIPAAIFSAVAASVITAAVRFLRPSTFQSEAKWTDVAPLSELSGEKPIMRSIVTEHRTGWASTAEEHFVYVLPGRDNQVLSSVCPHEGCNVALSDDGNGFFCPCHDSYFAGDGARVSGPSRRGLDPLPSRVNEGVLQIQYQSYVNNTEERIVRG